MKSKLFLLLAILCASESSYAFELKKSHYKKEFVSSVVTQKVEKDKVKITYEYIAESAAYSGGVNYKIKDGTLFVSIKRCLVKLPCSYMVKDSSKDPFKSEVVIPFNGEKIVMKYRDVNEEIILKK